MHRIRRSSKRALITAFSSAALVGILIGSAAAPAGATTFDAPSYPAPANVAPSPSAARLAPGLYVQVIDGTIHFANPGGAIGLSAGQFGYVGTPPSTLVPTTVHGLPSTRPSPPRVLSASELAAAQEADADAAAASENARQLTVVAVASRSAANTQNAAVVAAEAAYVQAGQQKEAAWPAFSAAELNFDEAEQALASAQNNLDAAGPNDDLPTLQSAVEAAQKAVDLARSELDRTSAIFDAAGTATATAHEVWVAATELAEPLASQADLDEQAATDATEVAKRLGPKSVPAIPGYVPTYNESGTIIGGTYTEILADSDIVLAAAGFAPDTLVAFGMHSTPVAIAPVTVDELGYAVAAFRVPAEFRGTHTFLAIGTGLDGLRRVLGFEVAVVEPAVAAVAAIAPVAPAERRTLAASGFDSSGPLLAGMFLVVGGGLILGRRRSAGIR